MDNKFGFGIQAIVWTLLGVSMFFTNGQTTNGILMLVLALGNWVITYNEFKKS